MEHRGQIQGIWNTGIRNREYGTNGSDRGNMEHRGQIQGIWSTGI